MNARTFAVCAILALPLAAFAAQQEVSEFLDLKAPDVWRDVFQMMPDALPLIRKGLSMSAIAAGGEVARTADVELHDRPQVAGGGLCAVRSFRVREKVVGTAEPVVTLFDMNTWFRAVELDGADVEAAGLRAATQEKCTAIDYDGEFFAAARVETALDGRTLVQHLSAKARSDKPLGFAFRCVSVDRDLCKDPRRALATMKFGGQDPEAQAQYCDQARRRACFSVEGLTSPLPRPNGTGDEDAFFAMIVRVEPRFERGLEHDRIESVTLVERYGTLFGSEYRPQTAGLRLPPVTP